MSRNRLAMGQDGCDNQEEFSSFQGVKVSPMFVNVPTKRRSLCLDIDHQLTMITVLSSSLNPY